MNKKLKRLWLVGGLFVLVLITLKADGFFSVTQKVGCDPPETLAYELRGDYMAGVCASEQPKEVNGFAFYKSYANYFAFDESAPYEGGKNPFSITQEAYAAGSVLVEAWTCGEWNSCTNSVQSRSCTDSGNTGRNLRKPLTVQGCIVQEQPVQAAPIVNEPAPVGVLPSESLPIVQPVPTEKNWVVWVFGILFILLSLSYAYPKWSK